LIGITAIPRSLILAKGARIDLNYWLNLDSNQIFLRSFPNELVAKRFSPDKLFDILFIDEG